MTKSTTKRKSKTVKPKVDYRIIVAIIGLLGTVATALFMSPTISLWVGNQSQIPPTPIVVEKDYTISSTKGWQFAGSLQQGDLVTIKQIDGTWTNNINNSAPGAASEYISGNGYPNRKYDEFILGAPLAALLGKIGTGTPFLVGENYQFHAPTSGNLYLIINDNTDSLDDNDGELTIHVTVQR
ncbi:MAG: hypothetical protein AABZ00_15525 [Chloroflexota bacterium]